MLISKLKNSKLKLSCTGPGPTNTRDEVMVTGEYLGCIRTQVTLDSSHHINHHAHYSVSFTVPTASISSRELELRCHMSQVSGQWRMSTIGRNNTKRDTTNTHWPLDITIIHSLAILWQKYNIILWHNINLQLEYHHFYTFCFKYCGDELLHFRQTDFQR